MSNGIMFNGDMPSMKGHWYNPRTGDEFTVKDMFFEDNRFVILTTDNRMLDFTSVQNYVQGEKQIDSGNIGADENKLPQEVQDLIEPEWDILPEDLNATQPQLGNIYNPLPTSNVSNINIIDKALSKRELPSFRHSLLWKTYPEKEINMLVDLMDIPYNEIVEWYISKIDIKSVVEDLKDSIRKHMSSACVEEEVETKEPPKRKPGRPRKKQ